MTLQFGWWDHFEQRADMPLWQQYDERIELIRSRDLRNRDRAHQSRKER